MPIFKHSIPVIAVSLQIDYLNEQKSYCSRYRSFSFEFRYCSQRGIRLRRNTNGRDLFRRNLLSVRNKSVNCQGCRRFTKIEQLRFRYANLLSESSVFTDMRSSV